MPKTPMTFIGTVPSAFDSGNEGVEELANMIDEVALIVLEELPDGATMITGKNDSIISEYRHTIHMPYVDGGFAISCTVSAHKTPDSKLSSFVELSGKVVVKVNTEYYATGVRRVSYSPKKWTDRYIYKVVSKMKEAQAIVDDQVEKRKKKRKHKEWAEKWMDEVARSAGLKESVNDLRPISIDIKGGGKFIAELAKSGDTLCFDLRLWTPIGSMDSQKLLEGFIKAMQEYTEEDWLNLAPGIGEQQ